MRAERNEMYSRMNVKKYRRVKPRVARVEILNHNNIKVDRAATQE
jgi:hypothetical protein